MFPDYKQGASCLWGIYSSLPQNLLETNTIIKDGGNWWVHDLTWGEHTSPSPAPSFSILFLFYWEAGKRDMAVLLRGYSSRRRSQADLDSLAFLWDDGINTFVFLRVEFSFVDILSNAQQVRLSRHQNHHNTFLVHLYSHNKLSNTHDTTNDSCKMCDSKYTICYNAPIMFNRSVKRNYCSNRRYNVTNTTWITVWISIRRNCQSLKRWAKTVTFRPNWNKLLLIEHSFLLFLNVSYYFL